MKTNLKTIWNLFVALLRKHYVLFIGFGLLLLAIVQWKFSVLDPNYLYDGFESVVIEDQDWLLKITSFNTLLSPIQTWYDHAVLETLFFELLEILSITWFGVLLLEIIYRMRTNQGIDIASLVRNSVNPKWPRSVLVDLVFVAGFLVGITLLFIIIDLMGLGMTAQIFGQIIISVALSKIALANAYIVYENQTAPKAILRSIKDMNWGEASFFTLIIFGYSYLPAVALTALSYISFPIPDRYTLILFAVLAFIAHMIFYAVWAVSVDTLYWGKKKQLEAIEDSFEISEHLVSGT